MRKRKNKKRKGDWVKGQQRKCDKKTCHRTENSALSTASHSASKSGDLIRVYHCTVCSYWHLTKKPLRLP